jgi:hypothetical protein
MTLRHSLPFGRLHSWQRQEQQHEQQQHQQAAV